MKTDRTKAVVVSREDGGYIVEVDMENKGDNDYMVVDKKHIFFVDEVEIRHYLKKRKSE